MFKLKLKKDGADKVRGEVSMAREIHCLHAGAHHLGGVLLLKMHPRRKGKVPEDVHQPGRLAEAGKTKVSFSTVPDQSMLTYPSLPKLTCRFRRCCVDRHSS